MARECCKLGFSGMVLLVIMIDSAIEGILILSGKTHVESGWSLVDRGWVLLLQVYRDYYFD